jgi:dTDP-4-amino-4,6-dideoxygalactose transaminase
MPGPQGYNYGLTEFQAALLLTRLKHLEAQNGIRHVNARRLDNMLQQLPGIRVWGHLDGDFPAYYKYCFTVQQAALAPKIIRTVKQNHDIILERCYEPMPHNSLFRPASCGRISSIETEVSVPIAMQAYKTTICLDHPFLLLDLASFDHLAQSLIKSIREVLYAP